MRHRRQAVSFQPFISWRWEILTYSMISSLVLDFFHFANDAFIASTLDIFSVPRVSVK